MKNALFTLYLIFFPILPAYSVSHIFRGLTGADGLSDLTVCALYKDSCGYVWMGTSTSVERFDGVYLKYYPIPGVNEKLKWVNTITETAGNRIWIGNDMGLWQVDGDTLVRVKPETIRRGVRCVKQGKDGTLYVGSEDGLYIHKGDNWETRLIDPNVLSSGNFIISIQLDEGNGLLWAVTRNGLYAMELESGKVVHYPNTLVENESDCSYRTMTRIGKMLYIGTMTHGIVCFDTVSRMFSRYVNVGCDVIMSLSNDGEDMLYVGTDGNGVHFISTRERRIVRSFRNNLHGKQGEGLRSNSVYSLLVDRDGLVWVGLYQTGVDYTLHQEHLFSVYKTSFFTSEHIPVRSIYISKDKKLIGSRNGLYFIDEQRKAVERFGTPRLRSDIVLACCALGGKVYVGTFSGGMYVFDLQTGRISDFEGDGSGALRHNSVFCFGMDAVGNLWIGSSKGVYCYQGNSLLYHFDHTNSPLPEGNVYAIHFDSMQRGWICTENGIAIWDPESGTIKKHVFPSHFPDNTKVSAVYEDSKHQLYFIVPFKGNMFVSDLAMGDVREIGKGTPLEGKEIRFITEDKDSCLWIGTENGLFHYDKKNGFVPYNFTNGIPDPNFLPCVPVKDEAGTLWLGNNEGLVYLPQDWEQRRVELPYPMKVTEVCVNGQPVLKPAMMQEGVMLDADQNNVTFRFSGFSYTDPAYVSYEYRLQGIDESWKILAGKSEAVYYNLPSGSYEFRVRRTGEPLSEVVLPVEVLSRDGWKKWLAVIAVCGLILAGGWLYAMRKKSKGEGLSEEMEHRSVPTPVLEPENVSEDSAAKVKEKYKTSNVSESECKQLVKKLEHVMQEEKFYANPDLKLIDLAEAVGASSHTLSYLFNQYLKKSFFDYVNDYRMERFKELVARKAHTKYTLDILITKCGFGSRASFFRNFKKMTGMTPNEYIKRFG